MTTNQSAWEGVRRFSVVHFLIALILLLAVFPFVDQLKYGDIVEAVLITSVLLSAVMAVGGRRRILIAAIVLAAPAVLGTWIDHIRSGLIPKEVLLVVGIIYVAFLIVQMLGFILYAPWVNSEVLCAAVATYLMLAILWAFAYTLLARLVPNSFVFSAGADRKMERFEALYFSLGTLTTVDYGDIIPVSNSARMLAMMEATTGVFFMAVLISRLVSLYSSNRPDQSENES